MRLRPNRSILRLLVLALALVLAQGAPAFADDRSDARTHYQAGVKYYQGGDYRSAIREFSAAHQLVPADLNNYNLALCYDKLGDPEPAIQYYRAYLDKVPNTDKRAEIDASIARLDAAAKSVAAKKAEEARKADEARKAEEAKKAAEEARKVAAAEDARKAEEARAAEEAKRNAPPPVGPAVGAGSSGTPGTGTVAASTGDAAFDRASSIDINSIRDQRVGGASSGMTDPTRTPPPPPHGQGQMQQPNAGAPPPQQGVAPNGQQGPQGQVAAQDQPKKADPVYKKWWFWAVVAVSAYVVYQIATDDSDPSNRARVMLPMGPAAQPSAGGVTLMRW